MSQAVTEFLQSIVSTLSTLVSGMATSISTAIGGIFANSGGEGLSDGGWLLAMACGIAMSIGLVRIAWNFFANIGHR